MKPFLHQGVFWLPELPGRQVPGRLSFGSDGLRLKLYDALREFDEADLEGTGDAVVWADHPVVHGRLFDDGELTLLSVAGPVMPGRFDRTEEDYRVAASLRGALVEEPLFDKAWIRLDVLDGWVNPPPLMQRDVTGLSGGDIVVRTGEQVLAEATCSDRVVRLVARAVGTWGSSVNLDQVVSLQVEGAALTFQDVVDIWVRPLQDMLIVCLGRPAVLTGLTLSRVGADRRERSLQASFAAVQQIAAEDANAGRIRNFDAPTLLLPDDRFVPFQDLVPAWLALRQVLPDVITRLCVPFYATFMYDEHRFAATYQAAEALAGERFSGSQRTRAEHKARVAKVIALLPEVGFEQGDIDWARGVLSSRNDKPLRELLRELLTDAGKVGENLLGLPSDFARRVTAARVGVAHGGADAGDTLERYWMQQALLWVLRLHLVRDLGVPLEAVEERVLSKPQFARILQALGT